MLVRGQAAYPYRVQKGALTGVQKALVPFTWDVLLLIEVLAESEKDGPLFLETLDCRVRHLGVALDCSGKLGGDAD